MTRLWIVFLICVVLVGCKESKPSFILRQQTDAERIAREKDIEEMADIGLLRNWMPAHRFDFGKDGEMIGSLDWSSGKFVFTGDIEESAKQFFEHIKPSVDEYIESQINSMSLDGIKQWMRDNEVTKLTVPQ